MPKRRQPIFRAETPPDELVQELADQLGNSAVGAGFIPEELPPQAEEDEKLKRRRING